LNNQLHNLREKLSEEKKKASQVSLLLRQNEEEFKSKEENLEILLQSRTKEVLVLEEFLKKKDCDNKSHVICDNRNNYLINENSVIKK
jgi:hypothetical protein